MDTTPFAEKVRELAEELEVPGAAVGVLHDGQEHYAFAGVTSLENPLEVDGNTLFQFGSTGKTYTATAMMVLVERGDVELDAPVRRYVPELTLADESVAEAVTIRHLFNHTAGWEGDLSEDTGAGDDALARYVAKMADIQQVSPLGSTVSYNNASLSLAGRVIEKVTGLTFENAMSELVLEPLGMKDTWFFAKDVISRRFAVGHNLEDGTVSVARPWAMARAAGPAGGMSATAHDQLLWARFHLGDGTAADGTRVLSQENLDLMKQATAHMPGSALGDAVGISWLLATKGGVATVGHGGTTIGQHSEFVLAPERDFAVISMTNCGPNGPQLNDRIVDWAFEHFLGVVEPPPVVRRASDDELAPYCGTFETIAFTIEVTPRDGVLQADITIKPAMAATLYESGEEVPDQPPFVLGLIEGKDDAYVIPEGVGEGMKGYFARGSDGTVDGLHLGGRLATRVTAGDSPSLTAVLAP